MHAISRCQRLGDICKLGDVQTRGTKEITLSQPDRLDAAVTVLDLVRSGQAPTRPELARLSGLSRNIVTDRVEQLISIGLLEADQLGPSTGGRAPRLLRFRASAGHLLVAELGATSISVGVCDLAGRLISKLQEPADVTAGPEVVLGCVHHLFSQLLANEELEIWGVGIGLPGPVEFRTGRPVAPPIMPGWDGFDVRGYFTQRYDAPVWVDNDVNTMALGELRSGLAEGTQDMIYVKIGTGIGASLVSGGRLHRGAQGSAGDIGHIAVGHDDTVICRCGQSGCLEALAGGAALARDGSAAAASGRSAFLAGLAADGEVLTAKDVARAARHGDPTSVELITRSARLVGETLSGIVNFFNPSLILLGGGVSEVGDLYLATVRQVILRRSLPLATRDLKIERSPLNDQAGLLGAAFMVVDELLSRERLGRWIDHGTPAGQPELTD